MKGDDTEGKMIERRPFRGKNDLHLFCFVFFPGRCKASLQSPDYSYCIILIMFSMR